MPLFACASAVLVCELDLTPVDLMAQTMFIAAWLSWMIEGRGNIGMLSLERNVYWAVVTLTTVRCSALSHSPPLPFGSYEAVCALRHVLTLVWLCAAFCRLGTETSCPSHRLGGRSPAST